MQVIKLNGRRNFKKRNTKEKLKLTECSNFSNFTLFESCFNCFLIVVQRVPSLVNLYLTYNLMDS